MELSGLIFVALALVWALVLIPKALKHHDELARTRSVDTVSDSARVLAPPARDAGVPQPRTPEEPRPAVPDQPSRSAAPSPRAHRAAAAAAARRRRRVLAVLVLADLGVAAAAWQVLVPVWAPVLPVLATVAFLVVARVLVRRETAAWARAVAASRRTTGRPDASDDASVPAAEEAAAGRSDDREDEVDRVLAKVVDGEVQVLADAPPRNEQGVAVVSGLDDTSSLSMALLRESLPAARSSLWDPLPVTLPTYVTKARATRSVRTIDLSAPGVSNAGRDAADSALVAEAATAAADGDPAERAVGT